MNSRWDLQTLTMYFFYVGKIFKHSYEVTMDAKQLACLTLSDVLLVTMETPYSLEAPVRSVIAVAIRIPT